MEEHVNDNRIDNLKSKKEI